MWMRPFTVDILRAGPPSPILASRFCPIGKCFFTGSEKSLLMLSRVVASFAVLSATGGLSPQVLALRIQNYDPVTHYHQIRDSWFGVRTPDGR